ncbi:MAG: glutamine-hydrolyzing GMP synthase [Anaerolineales bacterium]|nr:glutamine-hydrolyzing GMP synthase [Anaerolineales bacterium]
MHDSLAILDFGSQTAQLIARRVRECHVYSELFPWNAPAEKVLALKPRGFILSGGPASVYEPGAPFVPQYVLDSGLPILGICYGMQALTHALGGKVAPSTHREFGHAQIETTTPNPLLSPEGGQVWMSHGDRIEVPPPGFVPLARTGGAPIAAMGNLDAGRFAVQFHPEVRHTPSGTEIIRRFVVDVCGAAPGWTPESIIEESVARIRAQVGDQRVLSAVSGGVDSSVATALVHRAVGNQLVAVFVDTGLLRAGEAYQVVETFQQHLGVQLRAVNAVEDYMDALAGITDPEQKRRIIGEKFIRIFEEQANAIGHPPFLVQGTIYPDVVESSAPDRAQAAKIKTHHNVGGLPEDMQFKLVEPLRYLFKDEVRAVGEALGLAHELVWRQPFPGPGLAVRILGEITPERVERLRAADKILTDELGAAGMLRMTGDGGREMDKTGLQSSAPGQSSVPGQSSTAGHPSGSAQAFAVLLPVRSVGVMGDYRTYQEAIAIRAVTTDDFMTADWARLPHDLLARISTRIVNEVAGVNRVVYDITSKPPATIEWE